MVFRRDVEAFVFAQNAVFQSCRIMFWQKGSEPKGSLMLSHGAAIRGSVVNYQHFRSLYEQCMEEVNHVPPERRSVLLEIAETFNRLASECAPEQSADPTHRSAKAKW